MANTSLNTTNLIRQSIYSEYLQKTLDDDFLPEGLTRDMSEFLDGDTLFVPTIGDAITRKYAPSAVEEQTVEADAADTGRIQLSITEYAGSAWYLTEKLKEDSYLASRLEMEVLDRHMRAMKERYETDVLAAHNSAQTANDANSYNSIKHRWTGAAAKKIGLDDFSAAKLALDTANVPEGGRIAIVDAATEYVLNQSVAAQAFTNNPGFDGMVLSGFRKNMRYIRSIFGFDIYVSNRLPALTAAEGSLTEFDGTATAGAVGDKVNLFFSVMDDAKPVMSAWRRRPKVEGWVDEKFLDTREAFKITSRYGFATHRPQAIACVITSATP